MLLLRSLRSASRVALDTLLCPAVQQCQSAVVAGCSSAHHMQHPQQQQQQQQLHSSSSCRHSEQQAQQPCQQLRSLQLLVQQHQLCQQQQLLAGPVRHVSSSSSSRAEYNPEYEQTAPAQQPQHKARRRREDLQELLKDMPGQLTRRPLFQNHLSSKIRSRKPAIKSPARHQWRFCAEDYDPMEPWTTQSLPPYASLRAHTKDYKKIYMRTRPKFHRKSYMRLWRKNMAIADQRWRQVWEKKLAAARKQEAIIKKLSERIIRERSWQVWQLKQQAAGVQRA